MRLKPPDVRFVPTPQSVVDAMLALLRPDAVEDGLTMMISTHQISFAREVADRAMFLVGGSIVEEGRAGGRAQFGPRAV